MTGCIRAILLDWAGTTVDFGSMAPVQSIVDVFHKNGVNVPASLVREGMGLGKRDHVRALLLHNAQVAALWTQYHNGRQPIEDDVELIFQSLESSLMASLSRHSQPLPGLLDVLTVLRTKGVVVGSTTGYTRRMMDIVSAKAKEFGYIPDVVVCSDDVPHGRPSPLMIFRCAELLGIHRMVEIVKVGDTPADIQAGRNAGCWSVGVYGTGNGIGMPWDAFCALPPDEQRRIEETAARQLLDAGAHYVIVDLTKFPPLLETINARLAAGDTPM